VATGGWPGARAVGLGTAAGLAGVGLTGAGAGWAIATDESSSDAATTTKNLGNGINVTGSKRMGPLQ
jgi:hypothetical protein